MGARVQGRGAGSGGLVPRRVAQLANNLSFRDFRKVNVQIIEWDGPPDEKRSAGSQDKSHSVRQYQLESTCVKI